MLIKLPRSSECKASEITPEGIYLSRRTLLGGSLAGLALGALPGGVGAAQMSRYADVQAGAAPAWFTDKLAATRWQAVTVKDEAITPFKDATHYNNFYEFGPDKGDPAANGDSLKTEPWSIVVDGEVGKPGRYALEDFVKPYQLEERIYRLRCVEAWSMVIPWVGFPLAALLKKVGVTSKGKYVAFETAFDPEQMPGQKSRLMGGGIHYPYVEGLTIAEAMNELTLMSVGLYGKTLPPQNGAPIRLVVPWKYGFKSIKSIVRIRVMDKQPPTSWNQLAPHEYGFYANVNPAVDHPRWSQASERRIGEGQGLFAKRRKTLMFNGYEPQVGQLYAGMDLRKFF